MQIADPTDCGLFFGIEIPARPAAKANECRHYQQEAKRFIDANPGLRVAVLSGYWEKWLSRIEFPELNQDFALPNVQRTPKFDAVLKQTLDVFTSRGIRVVLIGQIPVRGEQDYAQEGHGPLRNDEAGGGGADASFQFRVGARRIGEPNGDSVPADALHVSGEDVFPCHGRHASLQERKPRQPIRRGGSAPVR